MTPFVWMFISSYEKLRLFLLERKTITTLIQLEYSGFEGATVPICTFTLENSHRPNFQGGYVRLSDFRGAANQGPRTLEAIQNHDCGWFHRASAKDFENIPGSPIAYWASPASIACFEAGKPLKEVAPAKHGMMTGDNNKWLRMWFEVSSADSFYVARDSSWARETGAKWFPYNKGGKFRRWFGNNEIVIFWENDGYEIKEETLEKYPMLSWDNLAWKITNEHDFFKPSCTWTFVSSSAFSVRVSTGGALFDVGGSSAFPQEDDLFVVAGYMSSSVASHFLKMSNPTLNFQVANVNALPWIEKPSLRRSADAVQQLVDLSKSDWDAFETSWDFTTLPLLDPRPSGRNAGGQLCRPPRPLAGHDRRDAKAGGRE